MSIIVKRDDRANAIVFQGSSFPTYWNGLLTAELTSGSTTNINIVNEAASSGSSEIYEYYNYAYTNFLKEDGSAFSSATEAIDYINELANQHSPLAGFQTAQSDYFINGNLAEFSATSSETVKISVTGSTNDFNTFVNGDIGRIYDTGAEKFYFNELDRRDFLDLEVSYFTNFDVADASHEIELRFTDTAGITFSKTVTQTQVDSADQDVEFITIIPFYIGDNLIVSGAATASAELFFTPAEDAMIKIKNFTLYLNR
jgi:hypothetical protein